MLVRLALVVTAAALLAVQVVRNALVAGVAQTRPAVAAKLWSSHPSVELSLAMTEIAEATRLRRALPPSAFAMIDQAAVKEPLAPEPYLVRGVRAELAGDAPTAERAFEAAQWRDPRSLPAAYFLAQRYLQAGDVARGLREVGAVARLSPSGIGTMAPYVAAYARNPANWPALRTLLRSNADLAEPTLTVLARDPATAPAVLALADRREKAGDAQWFPPLLRTLATAGEYAQARAVWERATGVRFNGLLYDPAFSDKTSPPPFNWSLTSSTVGLAERQPGGRLHVIFYGQEDGFLATQMLLLQPGAYRLSMQLLGDRERARALNWSVWCDKADGPIASARLDAVATQGFSFKVPAGCAAQWLSLSGASSDVPQQADVTIASLKLQKLPGA